MKAGASGDDDRFRWHAAARLFGPDGAELGPAATGACVIADRPGPAAVAAALARAADGLPFRIGAPDLAPPEAGPLPMFETLTSGSSGTPRRIRRSQASWTAGFAVDAGLFGIGPGTALAVPGRLSQSLSLYGAMAALHLGAALHLLDGLRPDRQMAALSRRGTDVLYATPALLGRICAAPAPPYPRMRLVLCGGAKLDPATRAAVAARFPAALVREFYGAAETSFITLADATTPHHAVGRPYPGVEIALRGPAGAKAIWVRSPYLFAGYAGAPGHARWRGGWLSVGEIGRWEAGALVLSGRADRMVTIADQNVFPEEIEAFLLGLPGVTRAAVLPRPDARRGHVLDAAITGGDPDAVLAACRAALGPLKSPRRVHGLAAWPLLPSGKTDLAALARRLA